MFNILPFILIVIALAIIIFVIVRRFPQLTLLDVDSIPQVKMEKKKDEILRQKATTIAIENQKKRKIKIQPLIQKLKVVQLKFRQYVGEIERKILHSQEEKKKSQPVTREERLEAQQEVQLAIQEGNYALEQGDLDKAEEKFIGAIKQDAKNAGAYLGLGEVYLRQKQHKEAEETLQFVLQLDAESASAMLKLANLAEERGDFDAAVNYYQQSLLINDGNPLNFVKIGELLLRLGKNEAALEAIKQAVAIEPQNPKYLDMLIENSVLCGNKKQAAEAWQELRMINPENQKLPILKEKIDSLE